MVKKIKCWQRSNKDRNIYLSKRNKNVLLSVRVDQTDSGWEVNRGGSRVLKKTKTHKQATNFAKSWMRSHDKC